MASDGYGIFPAGRYVPAPLSSYSMADQMYYLNWLDTRASFTKTDLTRWKADTSTHTVHDYISIAAFQPLFEAAVTGD